MGRGVQVGAQPGQLALPRVECRFIEELPTDEGSPADACAVSRRRRPSRIGWPIERWRENTERVLVYPRIQHTPSMYRHLESVKRQSTAR